MVIDVLLDFHHPTALLIPDGTGEGAACQNPGILGPGQLIDDFHEVEILVKWLCVRRKVIKQ